MSSKPKLAQTVIQSLVILNDHITNEVKNDEVHISVTTQNGGNARIVFNEIPGETAEEKIIQVFKDTKHFNFLDPCIIILPLNAFSLSDEELIDIMSQPTQISLIELNNVEWEYFKEEAAK